jgi:hypothetical protein
MALTSTLLKVLKEDETFFTKLEQPNDQEVNQALNANGLVLQYVTSPSKNNLNSH